jgi:hypothetical protein
LRIPRIPRVLGHTSFLDRGLAGEGRQRRPAHQISPSGNKNAATFARGGVMGHDGISGYAIAKTIALARSVLLIVTLLRLSGLGLIHLARLFVLLRPLILHVLLAALLLLLIAFFVGHLDAP